jgi:hypothetical protein
MKSEMLMDSVNQLLLSANPITLAEMDEVQLLCRNDTKYLLPLHNIEHLLTSALPYYRALEIKDSRSFAYYTKYLDTSDFDFYKQHVRNKYQRFKVRYRTYELTGATFLEVKCKKNPLQTIKFRTLVDAGCYDMNGQDQAFVSQYIPVAAASLNSVLVNKFYRVTLVNLNYKERVTIDFEIAFEKNNHVFAGFPYFAVAEIKSERSNQHSTFAEIMKKEGIQPIGFSKYCLGCAKVYNLPLQNTLKSNFLLIEKLKDAYECQLIA